MIPFNRMSSMGGRSGSERSDLNVRDVNSDYERTREKRPRRLLISKGNVENQLSFRQKDIVLFNLVHFGNQL